MNKQFFNNFDIENFVLEFFSFKFIYIIEFEDLVVKILDSNLSNIGNNDIRILRVIGIFIIFI